MTYRPPDFEPRPPALRLIGEPVSRQDGTAIVLKAEENGYLYVNDVLPNGGCGAVGYTSEQVVALGDGNYESGVVLIGHEHYQAAHDAMLDVKDSLLQRLDGS